jgi:DNA-binding beta-propeller fold protein YncE
LAGPFGVGNELGFGSALVGSAPTQPGPSAVAVDPATHTIYAASGNNPNGLLLGGDTVSVIDSRRCNAHDVSRCRGPWPTITVGNLPGGIAVDQATDTIYVSNAGDNTVSVVNGASCNALTATGCGQTPATVSVGAGPLGLFVDPTNHTVYVANFNDATVSMINSATCSAADLQGCPTVPPPTITTGGGPGDVDVNQTTHTVYVATLTGLSVFDANTCNASASSGCATVGQPLVPACDLMRYPWCGPFTAKVDPANNTIYESDGTSTVFVFDGRSCDANDLAGCATDAPAAVTPFPESGFEANVWVAVDAPLHTVYVTYQKDDVLVVLDANACNGSDLAGCATVKPQEIHTGSDPESVVLDPQTQTLYTANQVSANISVIDPTRCDAQTASGCRARVPEVPISRGGLAADPAVATIYVANGANTVAMIGTSCNAHRPAGCSTTPPTVTVGTNPAAVAVDAITHTVYVANFGDPNNGTPGRITVLDDRNCNATEHTGCATVSTLTVPDGNPDGIAVNPRTDTLYVATLTSNGGPNLISVFDGGSCNATATTGCGQTPADVATGSDGGPDGSTEAVAVNPATNTIYATSNTVGKPFVGDTVYVIDGPTCDAADTTGCGNPPATISVGTDPVLGDANPFAIAVDQATDTIYTANIVDGEAPGTISIINGTTCNSQNKTGCDQAPATAPGGFGTTAIALDPTTNHIYATNIQDASVTVINGNTCNGTNHTGCANTPTRPIVGDYPGAITVDPQVSTAYVADGEGVSVMALIH